MANSAGLVEISGMNVTTRPSFNALAMKFAGVNTTSSASEVSAPSNPPPQIPCTPFSYRDGASVAVVKGEEQTMSPVIPPKPNIKLCTCMMKTLSCIKNPTVPIETSTSTRKKLCNQNESWCVSHYGDTHQGLYHAYWLCNGTEKVSWALDRFYSAYNKDASACAQAGGVLQVPTPRERMDSACRTLMAQAGPDGLGNVTYNPYPLGADASVPLATEKQGGGGLDTVASKAMIGVAVGAVVAFAGLLGWLCVRRRRRRRQKVHEMEAAEKREAAGGSGSVESEEVEAPLAELDPDSECHEMDSLEAAQKHELEAGSEAADKPLDMAVQTQAMEIEEVHELESPTELSNRLRARQKEIEAYGGYDNWIRVQPQ
jgi:hypothetical protein